MRVLIFILMFLPSLALAQDKGFVASTLEQNLSGPGRTVTIDGFQGALSSKATISKLTVADDQGVWLTLKGVVLDWSRAALLSGKVEVNTLSADDIIVARMPASPPPAAPSAAASGFSLPDLPVSIQIGNITAKRVELGAPLLGTAAVVEVQGNMNLANGEGAAKLAITRIDGTKGHFSLDASYANASRQLAVDVETQEAAGGILTSLIGLPGAPALSLSIKGAGPIDAFTADIHLATDGQDRLSGTVKLASEAAKAGDTAPPTRRFSANLSGDIAPLFAPTYRDFFGTNIQLAVEGARLGSGEMDLSKLELTSRQIALNGQIRLAADGLPQFLDINGQISSTDGSPVRLPLPGTPTEIRKASLRLNYDATKGDGWTGAIDIAALQRPTLNIATLSLAGTGHITHGAGASVGKVDGDVTFAGDGVAPTDTAMAEALGSAITGAITFAWQSGQPLSLPKVVLNGNGYRLDANGTVDGLSSAATVTGQATATFDDLSRFSAVAKRPLAGRGAVSLTGTAALLAGSFDLDATVDGQNLKAGQAELDAMLQGKSHVHLSARRDDAGTTLRDLSVTASTLTAKASGVINAGASDLTGSLDLSNLASLGPRYGGAMSASLKYVETAGTGHLSVDARATDLVIGQPEADKLLHGTTTLTAAASRDGSTMHIDALDLKNPQVSAKAAATIANGLRQIAVNARLADLSLVAPGFPGPLTLTGTAIEKSAGYTLDLKANGPAALQSTVSGTVASDLSSAKLAIRGGVDSGIVNGVIQPRSIKGPVTYDLRLTGAPTLGNLAGTIKLGPARLTSPVLGLSADGVAMTATIGSGRAQLSGRATVGGGSVSIDGPVTMSAPFDANLAVKLRDVLFKNPDLFSTRASGAITVAGPLTGGGTISGALTLGATELQVPSTGMAGSAPIPDVTHIGETAATRATRQYAGLVKSSATVAQSRAKPFAIDLTISAPNQVFVRGRGLDAELGGSVKLGGTTENIIPSGGFDLLRGRLDILGKRFDLTQASLQLQGRFVPYVQVSASTVNDGITSMISIEGDASDPKITFASTPPLPQEEVLSQLLFGHSLASISAFQAAQLASAVATLAGKGGEGIVGRLRKGFGLDNFDVTTDATGGTAVKAGKYLARNVYSEVTVGADGSSEIDLNLNISKSVTLKGKASSTNGPAIGIYYERDY